MSWQPGQDPIPGDRFSCDAIEHVIVPRARDLGGFEVRRALPSAQKQMVGPFIFFDQMGPAEFLIGNGIDVRPHPHIGLATVTYLFEGEVWHRDSLGTSAPIRPGEVNLMTAGRGIVHSERERGEVKQSTHRLFGIQAWAALPKSHEEAAPAFAHHGAGRAAAHHRRGQARAPGDGQRLRRALAGRVSARDACSPRPCWRRAPCCRSIPTTTSARSMWPPARSTLPATSSARAGCWCSGRATASPSWPSAQSRLMLLGGEPMDGPRHIWWNFVSSSKERIEQAKEDWRAKRFALVPGDEKEFIPLPE